MGFDIEGIPVPTRRELEIMAEVEGLKKQITELVFLIKDAGEAKRVVASLLKEIDAKLDELDKFMLN